jgi:hypothetical protein
VVSTKKILSVSIVIDQVIPGREYRISLWSEPQMTPEYVYE